MSCTLAPPCVGGWKAERRGESRFAGAYLHPRSDWEHTPSPGCEPDGHHTIFGRFCIALLYCRRPHRPTCHRNGFEASFETRGNGHHCESCSSGDLDLLSDKPHHLLLFIEGLCD